MMLIDKPCKWCDKIGHEQRKAGLLEPDAWEGPVRGDRPAAQCGGVHLLGQAFLEEAQTVST